MSSKIQGGNDTAGLANVDANFQLRVGLETDTVNKQAFIGAVKFLSENDDGSILGDPDLSSPETDDDYRLRVAQDVMLDDETFNYTAQNTAKFTTLAAAVTLAPSFTIGGYNTNPTGITANTSGATLRTYNQFSLIGTSTLSLDVSLSFSALPVSNTIIDFGFFYNAATNPFAPTDGVYIRLNASGLQGIVNYNGTETSTGVFPLSGGTGVWTYVPNKKYQFIVYSTTREVEFWVNDGTGAALLGVIICPDGQGTPYQSVSLPFGIRHAIVGGIASGALNCILTKYSVRIGGVTGGSTLAAFGARALASYQAPSGGPIGSIGTYVNNTNPTAAVPTNTTNAVGAVGLLNQAWETFTLALNTDGILASYQVPVGSTLIQGKRLKILGVKLSSFVQTVLAGGPQSRIFTLAFGGTALNLTTAESAFAKARRIVLLPELTQHITAAQAVNTPISQPGGVVSMFPDDAPVYVNPGEFLALCVKGIGTVGTSGTIVSLIQFMYTWE